MKKFLVLLAVAIVSLSATAGVATIQPQKKEYEAFVFNMELRPVFVFHSFVYGTYDLVVGSDNEFEREKANIELGKTVEEAIESLQNIAEACDLVNGDFKLDKYRCMTTSRGGTIYLLSIGELEYTAGTYCIPKKNILGLIEKLKAGTPAEF